MRVAIVANNLGRTSGRVQGQVAMQMPQEAFSAKNGMHLSKSTYHRSTPRTICLCSRIAPGGQEFVHTWHVEQNSSAPKTIRVGRDERHVGRHARKANTRSEMPADQRTVFAEFTQSAAIAGGMSSKALADVR